MQNHHHNQNVNEMKTDHLKEEREAHLTRFKPRFLVTLTCDKCEGVFFCDRNNPRDFHAHPVSELTIATYAEAKALAEKLKKIIRNENKTRECPRPLRVAVKVANPKLVAAADKWKENCLKR